MTIPATHRHDFLYLTLALSGGVYVFGFIGLLPDPFASPIWPATGFWTAMYFKFGLRGFWAMTPGILIIQFQGGLTGGMSTVQAALFGVISFTAMFTECYLSKRLTSRGKIDLENARTFIRFATLGAPLGAVSSALQGVTFLLMIGAYPEDIALYIPYLVWFSGNLIGAYVLVPLLLFHKQDLRILRQNLAGSAFIMLAPSILIIALTLDLDTHLHRFVIVLTFIALFFIVHYQKYQVMVLSISFNALLYIAIQASHYTVKETGSDVFELLVLKFIIATTLAIAMAYFTHLNERRKLNEQLREYSENLEQIVQERTRELEQEKERAEILARTDPLTGINNRRAFYHDLEPVLNLAHREKSPLSVLILDIDHFKRINDTHGHDTGDAAICLLADTLRQNTRKSDIFARFGGEEFVIALPSTDLKNAQIHAEKIRKKLHGVELDVTCPPNRFSVSIGIAQLTETGTQSLDNLLNQADKALYQAKQSGRDKIVCADLQILS